MKNSIEQLNRENNEKINAFREQKQAELDAAKLELEAELLAESKAKSAAVRQSLAGTNAVVVVENREIHTAKQVTFNQKVASIKSEVEAFNKKVNEEGQQIGKAHDQEARQTIAHAQRAMSEKKRQMIEAVKEALAHQSDKSVEAMGEDLEVLGKKIVESLKEEIP